MARFLRRGFGGLKSSFPSHVFIITSFSKIEKKKIKKIKKILILYQIEILRDFRT